jgi:UrcA family protein
MSTKPHVHASVHSSGAIALCTRVILVLTAMLPAAALADQPPTPASEARTARVALGDLDLSNPEGVRVARDRLQEAARRLCVRLTESRDVGRQWHLRACINEAFADAWRQLSAPKLAAVPNSAASRNAAGK